MRRFIIFLGTGLSESCPYRLWRKFESSFNHLLMLCELDATVHVFPSRRAYEARANAGETLPDVDHFFKMEWSVTCRRHPRIGIVGIVAAEVIGSRCRSRRRLLVAFLDALCPTRQVASVDLASIIAPCSPLCSVGELGRCRHSVAAPNLQEVRLVRPSLIEYLERVASGSATCQANRRIVVKVAQALAAMMPNSLSQVSTKDALKRQHLMGPRRHRLDEDFAREVACIHMQKGNARDAKDITATDLQLSRDTGRWLALANASRGMHRQWEAYAAGRLRGVVSITEDGSRIGNPAEESQLYAWWSEDKQHRFWLVPQALAGRTRSRGRV